MVSRVKICRLFCQRLCPLTSSVQGCGKDVAIQHLQCTKMLREIGLKKKLQSKECCFVSPGKEFEDYL